LPLYPYRCTKCGHRFEKIQSFSAAPETECPKCGGLLERPLTAPGLNFKGAGWYVNDYSRSGSSGSGESSSSESKSAGEGKSSSGESKPSSSEGKSSSKEGKASSSESKPSSGESGGSSSSSAPATKSDSGKG
jgi:putative FmdB family regulatory protein